MNHQKGFVLPVSLEGRLGTSTALGPEMELI